MLARKDLVTNPDDQSMAFIVEAVLGMVGIGGGFLQRSVFSEDA